LSEKPKALVAWSSGKDSAWALHAARGAGELDIVGLLTTVTETYARVSMHGVREEVLDAQAAAAGLPLTKVYIPTPCSDDDYRRLMAEALGSAAEGGVTHVVHGDIALEGIREWREERLAEIGMKGHFPLWGRDAGELAREMISGGLVARVTCLDPKVMPRELAGALYDDELLAKLPRGVDPCAENGEFHTCALAGPFFGSPLGVRVGITVEREGFVFTDLELVR
jgi:uncharacterized protein (TIGR00290 family)